MSLTAEQIKGADDLKRQRVDVPEWAPADSNPADAYLNVRTLRGNEKDQFEAWWIDPKRTSLVGVRAKLAALCAVDDNGQRLFTDADADWLGQKSASALSRVFNAACELNALFPKDVAELEKNSEATASANSTSSLPVT